MPDSKSKNYSLRASIPVILRYAGLGGAVIAAIAIVIGFFIAGSRPEFRGKDFPGELSENVVGVIDMYNRKQTENGLVKYLLTADVAKTFDDNHQELDNITLELYKDGDQSRFDRISANRAVYLPVKDSNNFTLYFAGEVRILTSDELEVKTDQLNYRSTDSMASAEETVTFRRSNISGSSFGAVVDIDRNTLELQKDVDIVTMGSDGKNSNAIDLKVATLKAGYAFIEGDNGKVKLRNNVAIFLIPDRDSGLKQPTEIKSDAAEIDYVEREIRRIELTGNVFVKQLPTAGNASSIQARARRAVALIDRTVETLNLYDDVDLLTNNGNGAPIHAKGDSAFYERKSRVFELIGRVTISTKRDSLPFTAAASQATYYQSTGVVELSGAAEVSKGAETVKGDTIRAELSKTNTLLTAVAVGNSHLHQKTLQRETRVSGDRLKAWFGDGQQIKRAESRGKTTVDIIPAERSEFAKFRLSALGGMNVAFNVNGSMKTLKTIGRTTMHMDAGSDRNAASEKTLTADILTTVFRQEGNELATAHAVGNAELIVNPRLKSGGVYRTTVQAPRFDCEFFPGNNARSCESPKRSKVVRHAIRGEKPDQTLEADGLSTEFEPTSRSVKKFVAVGDSRFAEADKRGIAHRIEYLESEGMVRLRGGSPTIWDSRARAKAEKIDWNTRDEISTFAGGVSTTYFNKKQTGGAVPFSDVSSPVYLTAETARFEHRKRTAVYVGNARAWQENNYVRGNKIYLEEQSGRFFADGNVQSVLYDTKRTVGGRESKDPVFVSASSLLYQSDERYLRYEKNVDMRQGSDRIVAREADVYLDADNTLTRSVIKGNVEITQPNKKATGDYAQYDAASETVILRGKPAVFSDTESGTSAGNVITVDLKNNQVVNSGSSSVTGTGRIRSVYKVKKGRLN